MDIKTINLKIETLAKSERITKATLGELSRDLLEYIYINDSQDITPVSRLLAVLTPMNKATAILFFKNFLAWKFDDVACVFTKKNKKKYDDSLLAVELFLGNEDSNIWTWAEANVQIEPKQIDWTQRLTSDFIKAMDDGLTFNDIMDILAKACPADPEGDYIQQPMGDDIKEAA